MYYHNAAFPGKVFHREVAVQADFFAQLTAKQGDDRRGRTFTISDLTYTEEVWHVLSLGNTATTQVNLGGIGTGTGVKLLYVESDKYVKVDFVTAHGGSDLTTLTNFGVALRGDGCFLAALTNTTALWVTNKTTETATVQVGVLSV